MGEAGASDRRSCRWVVEAWFVGWLDFEQLVLVANFTVIRVHLVTVAPAVMSELMFSFPVFTSRAGGFEVHGLVAGGM